MKQYEVLLLILLVIENRSRCGKVYDFLLWLSTARKGRDKKFLSRTQQDVDNDVDKKKIFVEKWKTQCVYTHNFCFIPKTASRKRSFVDNSRVIVSTPCITVV